MISTVHIETEPPLLVTVDRDGFSGGFAGLREDGEQDSSQNRDNRDDHQ